MLWKVCCKGMAIFLRLEEMGIFEKGVKLTLKNDHIQHFKAPFLAGMSFIHKMFPKCGIRKLLESRNIHPTLDEADRYFALYMHLQRPSEREEIPAKIEETAIASKSNYNQLNPQEFLSTYDGGKDGRGTWLQVLENVIAIKECNNPKCKRKDLKLRICGRCFGVYYCKKKCQKRDWKSHKKDCFILAKNFEEGFALGE